MKEDKKVILKVLVGSRAHELHDKDSDYDYRSVYVLPTSSILSLGYKYKGSDWLEGDNQDNTSYELSHFLHLATKCNPTILEIFKAPIIEANEDGMALRELFNDIWEPKRCFDAFVGYGHNQRKKFLAKKDDRQDKYATAYIRVLLQLSCLLKNGQLIVKIPETWKIKNDLLRYKRGDYRVGEIIQHADDIIEDCILLLEKNSIKQTQNLEKVNEFLLDIRRRYW